MYVEWVILSFAVSAWEIRRFVHISSCGWINALFCFCSSICLWNKKIKKQLLKILCRMVDKYLPGCLGTLKKALFIRWLMHEAFCRPLLDSCHNSKHFFLKCNDWRLPKGMKGVFVLMRSGFAITIRDYWQWRLSFKQLANKPSRK